MGRVVFHIVTLFSLLLCVLSATLWVRSYFVTDEYVASPGPGRWWNLVSSRGRLVWMRQRIEFDDPKMSAAFTDGLTANDRLGWRTHEVWDVDNELKHIPRDFEWLGIAYWFGQSSNRPNARVKEISYVIVPLWMLTAVTSVLPLLWLVTTERRKWRARARLGQCLQCGYDRRGTAKDRACPECGASADGGAGGPRRQAFAIQLVTGATQGAMWASEETQDWAQAFAPRKGDVENMVATGNARMSERAMTDGEKRRVRSAFSGTRYLRRWLVALIIGGAIFAGGVTLFVNVVVPSKESGTFPNAVSWISMIAGGCTLIACVVYPPWFLYKFLAARADVRAGRVIQVTGKLMKYAKTPARYWVVGDRRFDIVDAMVWDHFADGEVIMVECLPRNGDILKIHANGKMFDALSYEGF